MVAPVDARFLDGSHREIDNLETSTSDRQAGHSDYLSVIVNFLLSDYSSSYTSPAYSTTTAFVHNPISALALNRTLALTSYVCFSSIFIFVYYYCRCPSLIKVSNAHRSHILLRYFGKLKITLLGLLRANDMISLWILSLFVAFHSKRIISELIQLGLCSFEDR